jgi:hypothetical protein
MSAFPPNQSAAAAAGRVADFEKALLWAWMCNRRIRNLGDYAVPWFTRLLRRFEQVLSEMASQEDAVGGPTTAAVAPDAAAEAGGAEVAGAEGAEADREKVVQGLKRSERLAYFGFVYAESKEGRRLEDREAYDLLAEKGIPDGAGNLGELTDYRLPEFTTWSRQLREARQALGEQKYTSRRGRRKGKSIVQGDQIERQQEDDR